MRRPRSPKRHAGPCTVRLVPQPDERRPGRRCTRRARRSARRPSANSSRDAARFPSTRPAVTDRYSPTVAASASTAESRSPTARVAAASSASSTVIGRPSAPSASSGAPRTTRSTWAMRRAQRPPSNVASDGSVWRRDAMTRAVLATASARSAARPSQNMRVGGPRRHRRVRGRPAAAARRAPATGAVGAEHPHVLGQAGRRPARVVAVVQDPAVAAGHHGHAVGSGDGVQADDDASPSPIRPSRNAGTVAGSSPGGERRAGRRRRAGEAVDRRRPVRRQRRILERRRSRGRWRARRRPPSPRTAGRERRSCSSRSPRSGPPPHRRGDGRRRRSGRAHRASAATAGPCARRGRAPRRGGSRAGGRATSARRTPARGCRPMNSTMRGLATVDGAGEGVAQLGREPADRRQVAGCPAARAARRRPGP